MTVIEFSDDQAALLNAQAQANGLTVQQWLWQLVEQSKSALFEEKDRDDDRASSRNGGDKSVGVPHRRLIDVLMSPPFAGSELDIRRAPDYPRSIEL